MYLGHNGRREMETANETGLCELLNGQQKLECVFRATKAREMDRRARQSFAAFLLKRMKQKV